jgi:TolB protein
MRSSEAIMTLRRLPSLLAASLALGALVFVALPIQSQEAPAEASEPLPERGVVIEIDSPERSLYKIAVPNLRGANTALGASGAEVLRNDLTLVSLFQVLDARSFLANLEQEGLNITPGPWSAVGAQGVIKGEIRGSGGSLEVEMRLYELARGTTATLTRTYRGGQGELRGFMHQFANEVLRQLTGTAGAFDSRLAFARRAGPGRKDVYVADWDGHDVGRVSDGNGVNMLPSFGPGGIWYSKLTETGMFITHSNAGGRRIIDGDGLNMGPTVCNGRVYFTSTRDGNSEIYSASTSGGDVRRITRHPAIDVSPACGPGGNLAFVSTRHGSPQIFTMSADGSGVRRVTFRGEHNQTPSWCQRGDQNLLAFTGRSGGMDVFTVNVATGQYTRLTQGQGSNKDPAFSPDCRMVAFASSRGGIFVSNPEGANQNQVIRGAAETLRWR